jgi:pyrroline-5-carboxylate reductase
MSPADTAAHPPTRTARDACDRIAFIGGGHMAGALIGGLRRSGWDAAQLCVVEPDAARREALALAHGVTAQAAADERLAGAAMVVWAVKPQVFAEAAAPCAAHVAQALQVSVMAGVRAGAVARAAGTGRVVRAMPNTPALIGQGMTGLWAGAEVDAAGRDRAAQLFAPVGQTLWLDREDDLDAVTALSGSGPAYVFFFLEAMEQAALQIGLTAAQGRQLAQATFAGAAALAERSPLPLAELRAQVTSKGGTTHAALTALQDQGVGPAVQQAVLAAWRRAQELGRG